MIAKTLANFEQQVKDSLNLATNLRFSNFDKIIFCGMGGSGIPGYVLRDLVDVPVIVNQGLNVGRHVDKNTLAFVVSYSGNTMETINMYKEVIKKTDKIVTVTSGGKLINAKNAVVIPGGNLPKNSFHQLFFPILNVLRSSGVLRFNALDVIKSIRLVDKSKTRMIAMKLKRKIPIVYAGNDYYGVALRWKQSLNETGKQIAIANSYPEFFHNEIEGDYSKFGVVILQDETEKRLEYFKKIVNCNTVKLKGNGKLAKMIYGIHTGDYTAYHLALLNKVDPDSEYRIDKLKEL